MTEKSTWVPDPRATGLAPLRCLAVDLLSLCWQTVHSVVTGGVGDVAGDRAAPVSEASDGATPDTPDFLDALAVTGWQLEGCEGEVLRESRFRPVFRYRVGYTDESGTVGAHRVLIGKANYREGGASAYAFMRRLWEAGFRAEEESAIPEPIAYLDQLSLLVQTEAPGRCLYEWLTHPETGLEPARAAGRWLARLHGTELPDWEAALPSGFEVRKLNGYRQGLVDALPDRIARIEELTAATLDALGRLAGTRPVPTHGDYQPKNIYVDGRRVTVIDWDRGALAPAARDLGHFVGQCLTMSYSKTGTFAQVEPWNDAFLEGYGDDAPAGWDCALAPYVARTILEVLYYKLVVKPVRDPSFVPVWLDALEDTLSD